MDEQIFLTDYFKTFRDALEPTGTQKKMIYMRNRLMDVKKNSRKIIFAGNGASASMASHYALDYTKQAKIRSVCFNDPALITAYGNDYGYGQWVAKAMEHYGDAGDVAVLISSSGTSTNIVHAATKAKEMDIHVIGFSGFNQGNPLNSMADIRFWVDCRAYNIIESIHSFWLAAVCDLLIGKTEYSVL